MGGRRHLEAQAISRQTASIVVASGEFLAFKQGMAEREVESAKALKLAVVHQPEKVRLEAARDLRFAKAVAAEWGCSMNHRDLSPGIAVEAGIGAALDREPGLADSSIPHRRVHKDLTGTSEPLRIRQSELVGLGKLGSECIQEAPDAIRNSREFVAASGVGCGTEEKTLRRKLFLAREAAEL